MPVEVVLLKGGLPRNDVFTVSVADKAALSENLCCCVVLLL